MAMPHYPDALLQRAAKIRLVGFDVDGTLTDGRLHYASDGHETKSFHVQDGMGLVLLREAGIELALVSARISPLVAARGSELKIAHVHVGERSKLACMQRIWPPCARPGWRSRRRTRTRGRWRPRTGWPRATAARAQRATPAT